MGERTGATARWASVLSGVLVTLACLLAPFSVAAVWLNSRIMDTDAFVATMAPLAEDAAVQESLADELTAAVLESIGVEELTDQLLAAVGSRLGLPSPLDRALSGLGPTIAGGIEDFARTRVENAVRSPWFAQAWTGATRAAHGQVVVLLEGRQGGVVSAQADTISLNLGPVVDQVRDELVADGFTLAERIPSVDRSFVLVRSESIGQAQGLFRLLHTLGLWLPVLSVLALGLGVGLARDRGRALFRGALGVAAAMLVLGLVLAWARTGYVADPPLGLLSPEAARVVFDTVTASLRSSLNVTAVVSLAVAIAAAFAGLRTRRAPLSASAAEA